MTGRGAAPGADGLTVYPVKIADLLAELDTLRARVRHLETALGARSVFAPSLRLTPAEAVTLGVLSARELASIAALTVALTDSRNDRVASLETLHVLISRLRRKLAPHGINIHTLFGQGYYIDEAGKAALGRLTGPVKPLDVSRETAGEVAP